ncbi:hypothetical protein P4O66_019834 [Electrophorus voltai]|uniref:Tf2-1-like SH3-like domain-containing protein n=1 Tax=Electrophorus voltai TaxID=2609070 RepID=A0AAD8ZVA0_9TELE|nr:hypothetical protein P4O66_019834 [Electrophorus voltai]
MQAFSPTKAMQLPLHREWDCAITLKEGSVPPRTKGVGGNKGWSHRFYGSKLVARYEGPYTITKRINEVTYRVGLPGNSRVSRTFYVSALKPLAEGPLQKTLVPQLPRPHV